MIPTIGVAELELITCAVLVKVLIGTHVKNLPAMRNRLWIDGGRIEAKLLAAIIGVDRNVAYPASAPLDEPYLMPCPPLLRPPSRWSHVEQLGDLDAAEVPEVIQQGLLRHSTQGFP